MLLAFLSDSIQTNNNLKYQKEPKEKQTFQMKELPSKEHHCYKIHTLLMKNNPYPFFLRQPHLYGLPSVFTRKS